MSDKPNPPKGIKKILNFIGVALTVLLIVMLIYTIVMLVMGRPVFIFGYSVVRIQTESMYVEGDPDSIAPGDFLIIKKTDPEDLKIGDIITFYSDNPQIKDKLNTHRIVEIIAKAGSLNLTKGDGYLVRGRAGGASLRRLRRQIERGKICFQAFQQQNVFYPFDIYPCGSDDVFFHTRPDFGVEAKG